MIKNKFAAFTILILTAVYLFGCASSGRLSRKENSSNSFTGNLIKVLLNNGRQEISFIVQSPVVLFRDETPVALIKNGNRLKFFQVGNSLKLIIQSKTFNGEYFILKPEGNENAIKYNGIRYAGNIKITPGENSINIINQVPLEIYLKGVIAAEMPMGKGDSYFQALKAFAVCARTYVISKFGKGNLFDIYLDTRDQVYGGLSSEKLLGNKAVDETRNMILTYEGKPAVIFYSSSCGGHTANVQEVFSGNDEPYLRGVQDGDPPNCVISPNFNWEEKYSAKKFIQRLEISGYLERGNYTLKNVEVGKRSSSGRVAELLVNVLSRDGQSKIITIEGNKIRAAIRKADDSNILQSTMFDVNFDGSTIVFTGKGNGHGVGLCQWGAIYQSTQGKNFKDILSFYFPGTEIKEIND
ncbi:MAG: SpoIID/LytB domain-containing protein [Ignavibacteriaceae bacterium]